MHSPAPWTFELNEIEDKANRQVLEAATIRDRNGMPLFSCSVSISDRVLQAMQGKLPVEPKEFDNMRFVTECVNKCYEEETRNRRTLNFGDIIMGGMSAPQA